MRIGIALTLLVAAVVASAPAFGELQNVQVGGSIRIRGNYYTSPGVGDSWTARNPLFQPLFPWTLANYSSWRPAGNPLAGARWARQPGRLAVSSPFDWDDSGPSLKWIEQRTRLNVRADFTDNVGAFVELDSYDWWGEDFRSNYVTGADGRAASVDDVEVYQAYIQAEEMLGYPLRLRAGRQELSFGSEWLIGVNDAAALFQGLSFDGVRLTYVTDQFSVDGVWAKLAENSPWEEDGDVDLYAVYASYLGIEDITLDAYWIMVRDAVALGDTYSGWLENVVEDWLGVDDYDVTNLHTLGLRGAGSYGAFDFDAEAAYQFGNADAVGDPLGIWGGPFFRDIGYGPNGTRFGNWGANLDVGYTFDVKFSPRIYLGFAYLGGEDNRDVSFGQWLGALFCPFWSADASVSFNRLFSNWEYSEFIENTDLSNAWVARGGVSAKPLDNLSVLLAVTHFEAVDAYDAPWPTFWLLGNRIAPLFPALSFLDEANDKDLGWEVGLYFTYEYSDDLTFDLGYAHLFVGDGLAQGNFSANNGLVYNGGTNDDDADYVFVQTELKF